MQNFLRSHSPIFLTIILAVYSQLVVKWHMSSVTDMPQEPVQKIIFLVRLLLNPWMISAGLATFAAGLAWMTAMARFELGYAYLYISLVFFLMMSASVVLFDEPLNTPKLLGGVLILAGIALLGYGQQN